MKPKSGYVLQAFEITNPFGLVLRHKIEELGIVRKQIAVDSDLPNTNYISIITNPDGRGASFATPTGPRLVQNMLDAEQKKPQFLLPGERKNFARRRKAVMEAMALLSIYSSARRQGDDPHALFSWFASIVPLQTYRNALTLVGEAILGPLLEPMKTGAQTPAMRTMFWDEQVKHRRYLAEGLLEFEMHHMREELFEARGRKQIENGRPDQALRQMMEGFEALREEETA